jgi:hypothetical protein
LHSAPTLSASWIVPVEQFVAIGQHLPSLTEMMELPNATADEAEHSSAFGGRRL